MNLFVKRSLTVAVSGLLLLSANAEAATTAYSMYGVWGADLRLTDLPVNDDTALYSSNSVDANYLAPNDWREASGALVASPNYGWSQGGGLPATWWTTLNANDTASVNSSDRVAARQAGGFIGGIGGNPADYTYEVTENAEPTALTVSANSYLERNNVWATAFGQNADIGLITLTQNVDVTITVSGISNTAELIGNGQANLRPGFSLWQNWDDQGGTKHNLWDNNGAPYLNPGVSSPFYLVGQPSLELVGNGRPAAGLGNFQGTAWNTTNGGTATLNLSNLAAGNYTIVIGGYTDLVSGISGAGGFTKQYAVGISTSAVPLPAGAWLFGPALAFLGKFGRRKAKA